MTQAFQVLPVLDLQGGQAVHARGGLRREYREVQGKHGSGKSPIELARALAEAVGSNALYVADLDAIEGTGDHRVLIQRLLGAGLDLIVDSGARDPTGSASPPGRLRRILATEWLTGGEALQALVGSLGPAGLVFGLDLRDGDPVLAPQSRWRARTPLELIDEALDCGLDRLIILDLGKIGAGRGPGTLGLVAEVKRRWPRASVFVGGGVAGLDDLRRLRDIGADGALVATALHDGAIGAGRLLEP